METNLTKFKEELKQLIEEGEKLRLSFLLTLGGAETSKVNKLLKEKDLPMFTKKYEQWYSAALQVIKQLLPDRLDDFKKQYKDEKRKQVDHSSYGVSDYLIGLQVSRGINVIVDGQSAFPKFEQQLNMLKAAESRLESSLFDMVEVLQAELFDNELEAAKELLSKGFYRASGALGGVVLERHLKNVCSKHSLRSRKKRPTINDYNQLLKDNAAVEIETWRFIQFLGDVRNKCSHPGEDEPSKDEITIFLSGVSRILKTLF